MRRGQVAALGDMTAAGHAPDLFTFTALINACQRANEAELAFEVLTCAGPAPCASPPPPRGPQPLLLLSWTC